MVVMAFESHFSFYTLNQVDILVFFQSSVQTFVL